MLNRLSVFHIVKRYSYLLRSVLNKLQNPGYPGWLENIFPRIIETPNNPQKFQKNMQM
jgi:hypothetical protein